MITAILKNSVEESLKEIKKCKIHILMLQEKNNELCQQNNAEIERFDKIIEVKLLQAEESLRQSKERKIETNSGWVAFRSMPDSWKYDIPKLMKWAKEDEDKKKKYIKIIEEFKKAELKKDITEGLLGYDEVVDEGLTISKQECKFTYKLNAGGELL